MFVFDKLVFLQLVIQLMIIQENMRQLFFEIFLYFLYFNWNVCLVSFIYLFVNIFIFYVCIYFACSVKIWIRAWVIIE